MAIRPNVVGLKGDSISLVNFIRSTAGKYYADLVPVAKADGTNLKEIGIILENNPTLANSFINTLVNRVGLTLIKSRSYENPWARFKKGILEYGETIEEIFVDLCDAHDYDVDIAENKVFAKENPNVETNFLLVNYEKFYKQTTRDDELSKAFLTADGVKNLVYKIIDTMYKSMNYDEFLVMKYVLMKNIISGNIKTVQVPEATASNMETIAAQMQAYSDKFTLLSNKFNIAGVYNDTPVTDQHVIMTPEVSSVLNVSVLSHAFNLDKAEVQARTTIIDSFSDNDWARLKKLLGDAAEPDATVKAELEKVVCVLLDEDFIQVWDKLIRFKEIDNPQGLYWNHFLHNWKIVGCSVFANVVVFTTDAPAITSVSIEPDAVSLLPGQSVVLSAEVATTMFAPQDVTWSLSADAPATINQVGKITIDSDVASSTTITVTATSKFDTTKTGTCTVTVVVPD